MKAESENILAQHGADVFRAIAVVDSTRAPVWLTDASGGIAFVNQAFADLTGMKRQQLLGDVWLTLMHPEGAPAVAAQRAAAWSSRAPYEFVARFRDAAGAWRWMRATVHPRFAEHGEFLGHVGIAVDETNARRALADLRESESRAKQAQAAAGVSSFDHDMRSGEISPLQRALQGTRSSSAQVEQMDMLGEPSGNLAHDFNNVLYSIVVALNLMQRRIAAGRHEEVGQYVDAALASAHRAASLASRLLAFAQRQSLDTKPVDVTAAVSSVSEHGVRCVAEGVGETVLVVEDEPQLRALVHEVLSDLGYQTLEAGDAPDALAQLETHHVDLLISDFGLPGLNGRQLAEMARLRSPGLPVLFMTGRTEYEEVRSTFLDTGMDLVTKPFEIDAFAAKIRSMMAQ